MKLRSLATHDLGDGRVLMNVHPASTCEGFACCIHAPSEHSMRAFPQHWREDRQIMERICPHGIGHPDPDHIAHVRHMRGDEVANGEGVHGCDGCCL